MLCLRNKHKRILQLMFEQRLTRFSLIVENVFNAPTKPMQSFMLSTLKLCGHFYACHFPQSNLASFTITANDHLKMNINPYTFACNNTPQASDQLRLAIAQTEGLLVSGGWN